MSVPLLSISDLDADTAPEMSDAQPPMAAYGERALGTSPMRVMARTGTPTAAPAFEDGEPLVDIARLRTLAGFPIRAVRRRARLARGLFGATATAAAPSRPSRTRPRASPPKPCCDARIWFA